MVAELLLLLFLLYRSVAEHDNGQRERNFLKGNTHLNTSCAKIKEYNKKARLPKI